MARIRDTMFLYVILVTCSCVLAKPMEGAGEDEVVNMEIGQDTPTEADKLWPELDSIDNSASNQEIDSSVYDSAPQVQDDLEGQAEVNDQQVYNDPPVAPANIPREQEERRPMEEIDWGHGGSEQVWDAGDNQQQQQQEQQQEQEEEPVQTTEQQEQEQDYVPGGGQQGGGQQGGIGVINPEEVMHGDDGHAHDQKIPEVDPNSEEAQAEARRQAEERTESEAEELRFLNPQIAANVHDNKARTAAEFMKDRQFGPNDVEEIIHGGHSVHGAEHEGGRGQVLGGDVEKMAHGEAGVHEDHGKGHQKAHLTVDPEHMMHAGQGGGHDHNPHLEKESPPGAHDMMQRHPQGQPKKKVVVDKNSIGPTFERTVHEGEDHVHEPAPPGYKPKNKVRYQDIIDLGLSQEALKGIDLSKVLEQEQKEFDQWQKEAKQMSPSENDGDGAVWGDEESEENSLYWQKQVADLRRTYLEKLYAKVRDISQPDLENAEWEADEDELRGHDGESQVEHEMEMWASTMSKKGRKPYKLRPWKGQTGDEQDVGQEVGQVQEGQDREEEGVREDEDNL